MAWNIYHRALPVNQVLTYAESTPTISNNFNSEKPTEKEFFVNLGAGEYTAFLYAHDTSPEGIIVCDLYNPPDGQGWSYINPNWGFDGAQYIWAKNTSHLSRFTFTDSSRVWPDTLFPHLTIAENPYYFGNAMYNEGSSGQIGFIDYPNGANVCYIAIRAPII